MTGKFNRFPNNLEIEIVIVEVSQLELDSDTYIRYVRDQAHQLGKEFFLDTGEGRDFIDPNTGMNVEDLSGWLFDSENEVEIQRFISTERELLHSQFDNYYFVIWTREEDGRISIKFKSVFEYKA